MTALRPAVAFGTKTRSSGRAPTNAASAARASAEQVVEAAPEELGRVALELALQLLVAGEHRSRARAVGSRGSGRRLLDRAETPPRLLSHGAELPPEPEPAAAPVGADPAARRAAERDRERPDPPVHAHLPAQRARDRPRHRGPHPRHERGGQPCRGPDRRRPGRSSRRQEDARDRAALPHGRDRRLLPRRDCLAGLRRRGDRGGRKRRLLAVPVDRCSPGSRRARSDRRSSRCSA